MLTVQAKLTVVVVATMALAATAAGRARAEAGATSHGADPAVLLNGLGDELNRTGRFGVTPVTTSGSIPPADRMRDARADLRVRAATAGSTASHDSSPATAAPDDFQYTRALGAVDDCRFDVARRRGVVPQQIAAGNLTLRWTIEASGAVRDAEATAASGTDAAVAACAKRVLTNWKFLKPPQAPVTVERIYTFRTLP